MARKTGSRSRTGKSDSPAGGDDTLIGADSPEAPVPPVDETRADAGLEPGAVEPREGELTPVEEVAQPPIAETATPIEASAPVTEPATADSPAPEETPTAVDESAAHDPASTATDGSPWTSGDRPDTPRAETSASDLIAPGASPETGPAAQEDTLAAEPVASAPPPSADPAPARSAVPLVLGGVVAAGLGALAMYFVLPQGGADSALTERVAALEARAPAPVTDDLESRLAALEAALAEAPDSAPADLTPLEERLSALESQTAEAADPAQLDDAIAAMRAQVEELEQGVNTRIDSAVTDAVTAALAEARAEIDSRAQGLEAREDDVATAQSLVTRRAALARLIAAAESGEAAPEALADLPEAPPALAPLAEGIATLPGLQQEFPAAARAALRADPVPPGASMGERLGEFFRSQTGARSLAPREGQDTDAVLSRAEAAVRAGDLATAVSELDALTGEPAAAIADWRQAAEERLAALAALRELQAQLDEGE